MNLGANVLSWVPRPVGRGARRAAYRAQQASLRYPVIAAHVLLRALADARMQPPAEAAKALEREYESLLARDLRNVEQGLYPESLLFQIPLRSYASQLPAFLLDLPRVLRRAQRGDFKDLPDLEGRRFPAYFRRTFHWQTDGYLSRSSARRYDLSVEFLFLGCADVMRRQVIPPMTRFARRQRKRPLRILDVGCGTGRTLTQIATALPGNQYFGVDLSPYYLEEARENLAAVPEVSLVAENAEKLPYRDDYFDIVTSVYLLHELPRRVRRSALAEMQRVLRPGGLLVIEDSAQLAEAGELIRFLEAFSVEMHEPYYRDYVRDDLAARVAEAGFETGGVERAWLSKVVTAHKPVPARS